MNPAAKLPNLPPVARLPLLLLGMVALLSGVLAGLARLGLNVPPLAQQAAGQHGALLAAAFFGTVIGLERAVALGSVFWYLAPLCAGLGGLALLAGEPVLAAASCVVAALVFLAGSGRVLLTLPTLFTGTLAAGALSWLLGNLIWLASGNLLPAVPLWIGFLVLTIAGERLELTRMLPPQAGARSSFIILLLGFAGALVPAVMANEMRPLAATLLGLALWLARHDVARRNLRLQGLPRFVAVCLLAGYAMLALGAALGLAGAFSPGHAWRDAALHAVFLGFVFAMVIGHAPIIFPAVMRVKIPYHPVFYLPLVVLQISVLARIAGGLLELLPLRQVAALGNAVALVLLVASLLARVWAGRRQAEV